MAGPFRIYQDDDIPTAAEMNRIMQIPQTSRLDLDETTTSTSYVNLSTAGPTLSNIDLAANQWVLVIMQCEGFNSGHNDQMDTAYMSCQVTGPSGTRSPNDQDAVKLVTIKTSPLTNVFTPLEFAHFLYMATVGGAHTFQAKYRSADATVTWHFHHRTLTVFPKA